MTELENNSTRQAIRDSGSSQTLRTPVAGQSSPRKRGRLALREVVIQSAGRHQLTLHRRVHTGSLEVATVDPRPSRHVARACRQWARTDGLLRLDAASSQSLCKSIMRKGNSGKSVRDQVSSRKRNGFAA